MTVIVMNVYEKMLIGLNLLVIVMILLAGKDWVISIAMLLVLMIILVQKIWLNRRLARVRKNQKDLIDVLGIRLAEFSTRIENIKREFEKQIFIANSRVMLEKDNYQKEMDIEYRDIARKMLEIENNMNRLKKTLGAGLGTMEERIGRIETELEIEEKESI